MGIISLHPPLVMSINIIYKQMIKHHCSVNFLASTDGGKRSGTGEIPHTDDIKAHISLQ